MCFYRQFYYLARVGFHYVFGIFVNIRLFLYYIYKPLISIRLVLNYIYGPLASMELILYHVFGFLVSMGSDFSIVELLAYMSIIICFFIVSSTFLPFSQVLISFFIWVDYFLLALSIFQLLLQVLMNSFDFSLLLSSKKKL